MSIVVHQCKPHFMQERIAMKSSSIIPLVLGSLELVISTVLAIVKNDIGLGLLGTAASVPLFGLGYVLHYIVPLLQKVKSTIAPLEAHLHGVAVEFVDSETELLEQGRKMATVDAQGNRMVWFNVPLGLLISKDTFDKFLLPALQNTTIPEIVFILKPILNDAWKKRVEPLIPSSYRQKVKTLYVTELETENLQLGCKMFESKVDGYPYHQIMIWGKPTMEPIPYEDRKLWIPKVLFLLPLEHPLIMEHLFPVYSKIKKTYNF